jgi:hypothetical protein
MKKIIGFLVLVVALVLGGCDTDTPEITPPPKYLTITGLPSGTINVYVGVDAFGQQNIACASAHLDGTKTEVTVSLKEPGDQYWLESHPKWTGSGDYILFINIYNVDSWDDADKTGYFYSDGQPIDVNMNGTGRYKFKDESPRTTIDLSKFAIPGA